MATRRVTIDIPVKVLLAEKTDEVSFAREMRILSAVMLFELGRLSSGRGTRRHVAHRIPRHAAVL
jgi:hypothetical protein